MGMKLTVCGAALCFVFALAGCEAREPAPAAPAAPGSAPQVPAAVAADEVAAPESDRILASIPQAFHGAWATDLAECAAEESTGKMSLTIGDKAITYSETSDAVISVNEIGPQSVRLTVDHDNDGEVRRLARTLTLSSNRQTLSFNYGDEPHVVIRCPQG